MAPPIIQKNNPLYFPTADVHFMDLYSRTALKSSNNSDTPESEALSNSSGSEFSIHSRITNSRTSTGSSLSESAEASFIYTLSREGIELRKYMRPSILETPEAEERYERMNPYRGIDMNMGWNRETYSVQNAHLVDKSQTNDKISRRFAEWSWKRQDYLLPVSLISDTQAMNVSGNETTKDETDPTCFFSYVFNTTGQVKQPSRDSLRGRHTKEDEFLEALTPTATLFPRDITPVTPATTASSPFHKFNFRFKSSLPSLLLHQNTTPGAPLIQSYRTHNPRKRKQTPAPKDRRRHRSFTCLPPVLRHKLKPLLSCAPVIKLTKLIKIYPIVGHITDELLPAPKRRCMLHFSRQSTASTARTGRDQRRKLGIRASRMAKMWKHIREERRVVARFWTTFCWVLDGEVED